MRPALATFVLGVLAATAGLAGCIQGKFFPAEVPAGDLPSGWSKDNSASQGGEKGFEPIVKARFQVNVYQSGSTGANKLFVISVSSVPMLDLQGEIKKQLDAKLADYNIQLVEHNKGTGTVGGDAVSFTVSDATRPDINAKGYAIDIPYTCNANGEAVRIFGFAATNVGTIPLGPSTWQQLAGGADTGSLGGLVTKVRCS